MMKKKVFHVLPGDHVVVSGANYQDEPALVVKVTRGGASHEYWLTHWHNWEIVSGDLPKLSWALDHGTPVDFTAEDSATVVFTPLI